MSGTSERSGWLIGAGLASVLGLCAPGAGEATPDQSLRDGPIRQEVPDDPPGVPARAVEGGPAAEVRLGPFVSIQVNVSKFGNNIPGDAANEPSIAVDPTAPNRMVIGWRQFDTIQSNFREAGVAYTNDGGRTWTFPGVIDNDMFRSDPVLATDSGGNFYYFSLTNVGGFNYDMFKSTDGGVSWSDPVDAWGGDKGWLAIDTTGGTGEGHIYGQWSPGGCCGNNIFTRSIDGAQTFQVPVAVSGNPQWGTVTVGPDGTVYVVGRAGSSGAPLASSTNARDSGQTPTFQSVLVNMGGTTSWATTPNPGGLLGQMWVDLDHSTGHIHIVGSVNPPGGDRLDVHAVRSTDGGANWSDPVRVNDDVGTGGIQWFGTMSVAPNGRIDVVWLDTRNDPPDQFSELFYSFSSDGGINFSTNIAVGPPFNHSLGYPQQNKLGDYYHMRSDDVGADLAYAATYNGEQDVYYLRIGDYDCNRNGIGDTDDLDTGSSQDCNDTGIPDECEIAAGTVEDDNGNGIPDECEGGCPWDLDNSGAVGVGDLLALFGLWGPCPGPPGCPGDFNNDGFVGVGDMLIMFANWGPCP